MRVNLIAIDDTRYWASDIQQRAGGKIYTVYAYNPAEGVCCCEARPSYWLEPLYAFGTGEPWDDRLHDEIQTGLALGDDGHYRHCSAVNDHPSHLKHSQGGFDDFADGLDYYQGNQCL